MSTLPPKPSYNPNIPIISSAGGTSVAYKDPNSPESIMKKTTEVNAQAAVDTSYDVNVPAHESFKMRFSKGSSKSSPLSLLLLLIFMAALFFIKKKKKSTFLLLGVGAVVVVIISIMLFQKYGT
jgi:hypothetical protein